MAKFNQNLTGMGFDWLAIEKFISFIHLFIFLIIFLQWRSVWEGIIVPILRSFILKFGACQSRPGCRSRPSSTLAPLVYYYYYSGTLSPTLLWKSSNGLHTHTHTRAHTYTSENSAPSSTQAPKRRIIGTIIPSRSVWLQF